MENFQDRNVWIWIRIQNPGPGFLKMCIPEYPGFPKFMIIFMIKVLVDLVSQKCFPKICPGFPKLCSGFLKMC